MPLMQTPLRIKIKILALYTLVFMLFPFVSLLVSVFTDSIVSVWVITSFLSYVPVIALALLMLLGIRSEPTRITAWILAGYTFVLLLFSLGVSFIPPFYWYRFVTVLLYLPVIAFAGLVLASLKRRSI